MFIPNIERYSTCTINFCTLLKNCRKSHYNNMFYFGLTFEALILENSFYGYSWIVDDLGWRLGMWVQPPLIFWNMILCVIDIFVSKYSTKVVKKLTIINILTQSSSMILCYIIKNQCFCFFSWYGPLFIAIAVLVVTYVYIIVTLNRRVRLSVNFPSYLSIPCKKPFCKCDFIWFDFLSL